MLGIRDILVRIRTSDKQIRIRIRLLSSVSSGCKNKIKILQIFTHNLPAGFIFRLYSTALKINFCVIILFCKHYFSPFNIFMRKGKDPVPDPYLCLTDPDPAQNMRIRISNTVKKYHVLRGIAVDGSAFTSCGFEATRPH